MKGIASVCRCILGWNCILQYPTVGLETSIDWVSAPFPYHYYVFLMQTSKKRALPAILNHFFITTLYILLIKTSRKRAQVAISNFFFFFRTCIHISHAWWTIVFYTQCLSCFHGLLTRKAFNDTNLLESLYLPTGKQKFRWLEQKPNWLPMQ